MWQKKVVMKNVIISKSPKETQNLGKKIAGRLKSGDVVAFTGSLGAGKTCMVRSILNGLGVSDCYRGTSPTFVLINEYMGRLPVYHFDIYRLRDAMEVSELGYEEYFYGNGITIIEWADKIEKLLPKHCIRINLKILGEKKREISMRGLENVKEVRENKKVRKR